MKDNQKYNFQNPLEFTIFKFLSSFDFFKSWLLTSSRTSFIKGLNEKKFESFLDDQLIQVFCTKFPLHMVE